ncbi:MAG: bifunctional [glutamine synthetase] adenylyltransferase/[glutamine synthetase]-adenylyl-L-tyrosine phosphorylase, partial [Actinomycetes bacterium]
MSSGRGRSARARLARVGFTEPERAAGQLGTSMVGPLLDADDVLASLSTAADPDAALDGLARLLGALDDPEALSTALCNREELRNGLLGVLGASRALCDHLVRIPDTWRLLA